MLGSLLSKGSESVDLLLLGSDGSRSFDLNTRLDGESSSSVSGDVEGREVDLLALVGLVSSGDNDQSLLVSLESVSVELQRLFRSVSSSVVDWDTN